MRDYAKAPKPKKNKKQKKPKNEIVNIENCNMQYNKLNMEAQEEIVIVDYDVRRSRSRSIGFAGITAMNLVGNFALFIRMLIALGITFAGTTMLALAVGFTVPSPVLWTCFSVQVVAIIVISCDAAAVKWMVEKLLNELSKDVLSLKQSLATSAAQISQRDEQLAKGDAQIKSQELLIEKSAIIQANMKTLLESLMSAGAEGANLNKLFSANLDKFDKLLSKLSSTTFTDIDSNSDGVIDPNEFRIYTSRSMHRALSPTQ